MTGIGFRIPITTITVFGASILLTVTVGIVLYLGFNLAAKSTRQLWADQAGSLINAMEQSLEFQLKPIRYQAQWIAKDIHDLSNLALFDDTMFGALAATPQVVGAAIVTADGRSRRWLRSSRKIIDEDWSNRPEIVQWLETVRPVFMDEGAIVESNKPVPFFENPQSERTRKFLSQVLVH